MQLSQVLVATIALMPSITLAQQPERPQLAPKAADTNDRFAAAKLATNAGRIADAIAIYRQLERDPSVDVRCEARFQHSQLLIAKSNYSGAAVLLRATLDEKPDWQRARLAFARALARIGREPSARRELRQAQVTPVTAELQPQIDTFADTLLKVPPVGGTLEVAFAPNSNIDRASAATLLSPEVLPFSLTRSPPVFSGNGLRISSQLYGYLPITSRILATAKLTLNNHLYPTASYDDHVGTLEAGAVAQWHRERLHVTVGDTLRIYGSNVNSQTGFVSANWLREIGTRDQIELGGSAGDIHYENTKARDGKIYVASLTLEHAFAARAGGRFTIYGERETARTASYASYLVGANALAWHEFGKSTVFASLAVQHLTADGALAPAPTVREDWLLRGGCGIALRKFKVLGFAPSIRASYTRNLSTISNQRYSNPEGEFALNHAF